MSALARLDELLREARRECEAAVSQVPAEYAWDLRHLGAQVQAVRLRAAEIRQATHPEPPPA